MRGKEKCVINGNPEKGGNKVEQREAELKVSLVEIHREGAFSFVRINRKTPALQSNQGSLRGLRCSRNTIGKGQGGRVISIKRATGGRR